MHGFREFDGDRCTLFLCSPLRKNGKYDILKGRMIFIKMDEIGGIAWRRKVRKILRIKRLRDRIY